MDVTGTDPRTRAGLFLWPWAATGYSNMSTNVANGVASTTAQSVPNAPAASLGLPHVPQMTAPGMFGAAAGPGNSQPTDDAFESFYSRLSYSTGVHSSHMSSLQQQMQQREQRTCEAPNSDMQGTRVSMIQGQQSLQQQHRQQQQQQTSGSLSGLHRGEQQQQQGPFADQRLMNGMMHRPSQQQAAAAIAAIASAAASRNSAAAAAVAASAPTANSASSSPLNSGAFHNPPLSPQGPPISLHQQQHSHLGHPLQQQPQQQQRPYSSTGSLHNVSTTVPSSPLDGRMSSSASPSVSSASAAGNYCLKRHPPNDFNSATAMALAVAVAAGDRHAQMQQQQELGGGVVGSRSPPDQLHHALGGHIASTADVFSAATGPGQTPAQYLFPPSSPMKSFYRRPSEAAAMAAAMAAQAARDASGGMNVHAGGGGGGGVGGVGGGDRSMSMAAHQRLLGGHGGFLLSNMGAAAAAAAAVSSSAHSPLDRVPDFLSDMRLGQETPVSGSGGPLQQGGPGSNQSIGQSHSGGLGSETALDTLPSLYGHAAKGYKCKICQHVCFSRQDLSTHNSTTHKQDPRPYRCDQCGRQFSTCAYLSQHRRIHSGIKPYVCRYCDRKFTQLSHVQQHERIHTGEKPYKCVTCFKSFTQMSNLQSHQRQHMKGKPHRCENCFMSYDTKEDLDLHVQAKHAGNRYAKVLVCPACSKSYNSETYLSKHMERHKEAVTNSSVGRLGLNSSGALGALSGFVNPGRGRSGSTGDLHDEIQHYPELHHLQHAAAAAAASFMPHSESSLLHHLPPGLQGQNAAHLVAAAAAHKSEQQAGQQGHHTAGGGGLIEQSQHHVSPSSSSSGRMSVGHTPYPQQQQHHQHHHQQILAAAAASHHLASSYAGTGQMPAFLNKPPSLEECMNAEELVASGLRHVARFSDSKTGFQSLAAAAVVTSPTPQPPPIAHQQTRGGQMIGDPSPRQQDNFQQYCRSPAEDQHHPQQHTDSADSLDGRSQSPGFRGPPKETGIGDKRVRKPPLEAWEQHVVSGGQMPESARINSMESSATGTVTGSTSSHLGADEAVGCRSLGFYSHLSAAKRLKPDPDELEEEEDSPRHLTVSDQKDCSRAGKRISLDESSAVSGGSSSSSSNHQRNFGTEFLRRSAPNSASSCTADTLFHSRSHQEYNPQRQQQQHHHHPQQQQQQHQMTNLPQETMTHTVENVVDKLAKFFPLVGAGGADKRNVNTSVRDLRIEALLAGFQGQAQDARGVLPGTNDEEDEDDEADEEEEEEEIEEERRTKLSTGHLAHASRTDKGSGSQLSSSYRSESVSTTAKIPAVASSPSMEDFRTSSQQPVGQSARAFMEEDIRNERSHGSVQKVPGSINFVQRQSSVVGGSPSPVPPSSSPVYSTEESRYGRGLQGQANGQFFQRSGFFESSKLSDTGSGSQTYDPTNSTPSTPPPPTTKESDENSFCEALGHRHVPFGHSGKLGLTVHGSPLARDLSGKSAESSLEEQQQQQDQQQQQSRSRGGINFLSFPDQ